MRVLFMCPHGAAKSVMATAIARDLVADRGLEVVCVNAGTDPDPVNNPLAIDALRSHGLAYDEPPRLIDQSMLEAADLVVAVGRVADELPSQPGRYIDWTDVPDASAGPEELYQILIQRIRGLLDGVAAVG